jgi:hypothetical protein
MKAPEINISMLQYSWAAASILGIFLLFRWTMKGRKNYYTYTNFKRMDTRNGFKKIALDKRMSKTDKQITKKTLCKTKLHWLYCLWFISTPSPYEDVLIKL